MMAAIGLTTATVCLQDWNCWNWVSRNVLRKTKGQVQVEIAFPLILNKNDSLIGQTAQPVKVGSTEITNQTKL